MAYLVFVGVIITTLVTFISSSFVEPQCTCSKFHYEEQLLEKMIRTEIKYEELQKSMEKDIADMEQKYAAFVDITREQLEAYEGKIVKSVAEDTKNVMANVTEVLSAFKPVAFRSKRLADLTLQKNQTLVFQDTLFNQGSGYDNTTGIFTAPVAGLYQFDAHICLYNDKAVFYAFVVDGVEQTVGKTTSKSYNCGTFDALVELKLGARVWIVDKYTGSQMFEDGYRMNYFSGFLVR